MGTFLLITQFRQLTCESDIIKALLTPLFESGNSEVMGYWPHVAVLNLQWKLEWNMCHLEFITRERGLKGRWDGKGTKWTEWTNVDISTVEDQEIPSSSSQKFRAGTVQAEMSSLLKPRAGWRKEVGKGLSIPLPGGTNTNFLAIMFFLKVSWFVCTIKQGWEWPMEIPHASPYYPGKQSSFMCLERPSFQRRSLSLKCR